MVVGYAQRDVAKPVGVATYRLLATLPTGLQGSLSTVEQLEAERAEASDTSDEVSDSESS